MIAAFDATSVSTGWPVKSGLFIFVDREVDAFEGRDGLLAAVLEDLEVVLREAVHKQPILIHNAHIERDRLDIALERRPGRLLRRQRDTEHKSEKSASTLGHSGRPHFTGCTSSVLVFT